jgi:hypothetical protein
MGAKIPGQLQGKSLVPVMKGEQEASDYVFIEWNPDPESNDSQFKESKLAPTETVLAAVESSSRAVIAPDGWKLCLSSHDKNQLFDLNKDSLETTNLFYDPKYRDKVRELALKILEWQVKTGDTLKIDPVIAL